MAAHRKTMQRIRSLLRHVRTGLAVEPQAADILVALYLRGGEALQRELQEDAGAAQSSTSRNVLLLAERGLVVSVENPDNRRHKLVRITEAGREQVQALCRSMAA